MTRATPITMSKTVARWPSGPRGRTRRMRKRRNWCRQGLVRSVLDPLPRPICGGERPNHQPENGPCGVARDHQWGAAFPSPVRPRAPSAAASALTINERPLAEVSAAKTNWVAPFIAAGRETLVASRFERDHAAAAVGL